MVHTFLIVPLLALTILLITATFYFESHRKWWQIFSLLVNLVHLACAVWVFVQFFDNQATSPIDLVFSWVRFSENDALKVFLKVESSIALVWVILALLGFIFEYFIIVQGQTLSRGQNISRTILMLGSFLLVLSANLLTFYLGWLIIAFAIFLGIALNFVKRELNSEAALKYYLLSFIAEFLFFIGLLSIFNHFGTINFSEINSSIEKIRQVPFWASALLVTGLLCRSLQLPLLTGAKCIGSGEVMSLPFFIIGNILIAPLLLAKLFPLVSEVPPMQYFTILPVLTCLFSAAFALSEARWGVFFGWVAAYICGAIFLAALNGDHLGLYMLAISGSLLLLLLAASIYYLPEEHSFRAGLIVFAAIFLMGIPLGAFATGRYYEYLAILSTAKNDVAFGWVVLVIKIIADLLMGIALWRVALNAWRSRDKEKIAKQNVYWERVIVLFILALLSFSAVLGGRPFSGLLGATELDLMPSISWFERLQTPNSFMHTSMGTEGMDPEMVSRIMLVGVFIVPMTLALAWVFRDKNTVTSSIEKWSRVVEKVNIERMFEFLLWDFIMIRVGGFFGKIFSIFDRQGIEFTFSELISRPLLRVKNLFHAFDAQVIDRFIVENIGRSIMSLGRGVRVIQNGQVQFYLTFGLILMISILLKYVFNLGG